METTYKTAQDIRADSQDLAVLGRSTSNPDLFTYAVKPSLEAQRQLYAESVANEKEQSVPAFKEHWKLGENGIEGSSTFLKLRFDKIALRPRQLRVPSLLEAEALDNQGKLENGVYRDYGAVLYDQENPNKKIAEVLARGRTDLPLVLPFRALDYVVDRSQPYGVSISIVENPQGIISGKKAQEEIAKLNFKGDSGFHRLGRYRDGYWDASWCDLDNSGGVGRVDWFCGEATAQNLKDAHEMFLEREFGAELRRRKEQFDRLLNQ